MNLRVGGINIKPVKAPHNVTCQRGTVISSTTQDSRKKTTIKHQRYKQKVFFPKNNLKWVDILLQNAFHSLSLGSPTQLSAQLCHKEALIQLLFERS